MKYLSLHLEVAIASGKIHPVRKANQNYVSRLFFADDLLIFTRADKGSFKNIYKFLQNLSFNTGLSVNKNKSRVYFSKSCHNKDELKDLTTILKGALPTKYLGLPLSIN